MSGGNILEPGVLIRPQTTSRDVVKLAENLYDLTNIEITEFNAYDDRNYFIKVSAEDQLKGKSPDGYILKIINSLDSKKLAFIEAQNDMLTYLGSRGILCPQPVHNVYGQYYSLEKIESSGQIHEHVVRLLTFQPGKILHHVQGTLRLFYQAGQYIANLDQVLQGFHHPAFDTHKSLWMLSSVPMLRKFQYAIRDEERTAIVTAILDEFDTTVMSQISRLQQGMLHGDFNEQNILVRENGDEGWEVHAVIDFGDAQYSCYIFDLAIAMCYMMLQAKHLDPLDVGGHVLAGYQTIRTLPDVEFKLLKVCICARLCQSLVLGAYTHLQDPGNEYILTTQTSGWNLLTKIYNVPKEDLENHWRKIVASYKQ